MADVLAGVLLPRGAPARGQVLDALDLTRKPGHWSNPNRHTLDFACKVFSSSIVDSRTTESAASISTPQSVATVNVCPFCTPFHCVQASRHLAIRQHCWPTPPVGRALDLALRLRDRGPERAARHHEQQRHRREGPDRRAQLRKPVFIQSKRTIGITTSGTKKIQNPY